LWLPQWYIPLVGLIVVPLAAVVAQRVTDSFAATAVAPAEVASWAPRQH
jgi:tellurite resistance protein TehA-like permease